MLRALRAWQQAQTAASGHTVLHKGVLSTPIGAKLRVSSDEKRMLAPRQVKL
jgi:hypothetical protein